MGEEPRETHGPSGPPCMSSSQAGRTGQERSHMKGSEQGLEYRGRPVTHTHHTACTGAGLLTAQQVTLHQDSSPCPATSRQHCQEQCSVWSGLCLRNPSCRRNVCFPSPRSSFHFLILCFSAPITSVTLNPLAFLRQLSVERPRARRLEGTAETRKPGPLSHLRSSPAFRTPWPVFQGRKKQCVSLGTHSTCL